MSNLYSVINNIQENQNIDRRLVIWLLQQEPKSLNTSLNRFFETSRLSRKMIANVRQLTNILIRIVPTKPINQFLQGERISFGLGQVTAEFFELLGLLRQKISLTNTSTIKISCNIIGIATLTITTLGINSIPILAAANVLRGITNFIKGLLRQIENKKKLYKIATDLNDIRNRLLAPNSLNTISEKEQLSLCLKYAKLKIEFNKCSYIVNTKIISYAERISLAANFLLILGSVMTIFPPTASIGLLLITISTATRFLTGIASIFGDFKTSSFFPKCDSPCNRITP